MNITPELIISITALLAAITTLVKVFQNSNKIHEIHLSLNSRLEEFVKLTKKSSFAEGVKSETDKQQH